MMPMTRPLVTVLLVAIVGAAVVAQRSAPRAGDGDWPMYSRDFTGSRFSPLAEIDTGNVSRLTQAWSVPLTIPGGRAGGGAAGGAGDGDGDGAGSNPQVTPIVIDGVMYLPARGNQVLALDADSGTEIWRYEMPQFVTTEARGVAYWPGEAGMAPRILLTAGPRLLALDAATGRPAAGFGRDGYVEIMVPWRGVPVIYEHVAILGAYPGEVPLGPTGDTRAFDVRTGKKLWQFHTVPLPGEPGHETWLDYGWRDRSGTNVWAYYMTIDADRGILYMPVSSPAANYWGGDRPGANLFGNSIVAVDAETGKYRWHFQTVHHDLWDFDMPSPPVLVDIVRDGQRVPALASIGKTGYMFILDRVTGKPIFGVEERPVPAGNVPDEWYSPTQPFPLKPAQPFSRVEFNKERDFVRPEDTSPQHVAECQALWDKSGGFHNEGPFTPWLFHEDGAPPRSSVQFPGAGGGVNWGGPAADPRTGMVFFNSRDSSLVGWIERKKPGLNYGRNTEGSTQPYDRASVNGPGPYFGFTAPLRDDAGRTVANLPCWRPPWGRLVAVNANTGDVVWDVRLGLTEGLPEEKRLTGNSGSAGPSVTAGGLVFVGATSDRRLRAFDTKTGEELWSTRLQGQVNANPMIYRGRSGKQFVAAVATNTLVAFALP